MSTEQTTGGFVTDPAEAFNPPAASGCCGSATTADSGGCCGSTEAATTEGCCG